MTKILYVLTLFLVLGLAASGVVSAASGQKNSEGAGSAICDGPGGACIIADFIGSPTDGTVPLRVQFLDSSTGYPSMWAWDFGDGNTASGTANPVHIYSEPGIYTVSLTATSITGATSTKVRQRYIIVRDKNPLEADFLANPTYGKAPLFVQFTDCSKGAVQEWKWDFGDGETAYEQNPSHTYQRPGKYTVTLTVSSPTAGSSTKVKEKYIIVEPSCIIEARFKAEPTSGSAPLTVKFTDLSVGGPTMWAWDFGDGSTDMVANPTHIFKNPGTYQVRLTASSQTCEAGVSETTITVSSPPIKADFSANPTTGEAPLTVQFTDLSTGNPTMWNWDFGDGNIIPAAENESEDVACEGGRCPPPQNNIQNPVHTYRIPGTYAVTLTASNKYSSDTITKTQFVTVSPKAIKADFSANPRSGEVPLTVQFTDLSIGNPTMWAWDFGDGATDMIAHPVHTYNAPGTYAVTLTASNQYTSDTITKTQFVTVSPKVIKADFSANPRTGEAPLTVQFTDLSTGNPTMWNWDFGDGNIIPAAENESEDVACEGGRCPPPQNNIQNPVHTYRIPGTYAVTLTASNQYTSDTVTKTQFVTVSPKVIKADFSADPRSGEAPLRVQFTDLSTGNPTMWNWDFGDGNIIPAAENESEDVACEGGRCPPPQNNVKNPVHVYRVPGTYAVTLTASNQYTSDTVTKTQFVTVSPKVIKADFSADPRSGEAPLRVQFTDLSTGNPTMWNWDFGDGNIIPAAENESEDVACEGGRCPPPQNNVKNPVHIYRVPGTYAVTLTASNQYTSDTVTKTQFVTVNDVSINADFVGTPTNGYAPLTVTFTDTSTGKPTMWAWDFGDGTTDMVGNPVHTYTQPGVYTVTLTASSQYGSSDTEVKQGYITVTANAIVADFDGNPRSGCAPLTVQFTDKSSDSPTMWNWDFGDGNIIPAAENESEDVACEGGRCPPPQNNVKNPVHVYRVPGTYAVTLTASNQYGATGTATKQAFITVESCPPVKADFDGNPRTGVPPLSVTFTDKSTGNPTMWAWDFGDGATDMIANPIHTYTKEGKYTVTLTASNKYGSDTVSKSEFISVSTPYDDNIPISGGWNFISVPKKLAPGYDTASIFSVVDSGGHSMFQYDTGKHLWNTMDPSTPVKPLEGFWIYSKGTSSVPIRYDTNPVQTPPTGYLKKGWNGIGFTGNTPMEAKFTLLSVQDKWVNCAGFNAQIQQYDPMIIKGSNDGNLMYPFRGYWLYMTADGVLAANAA